MYTFFFIQYWIRLKAERKKEDSVALETTVLRLKRKEETKKSRFFL